MTIGVGRRQFISALGGAAAAWSLAAQAQQPSIPVIGFLDRGTSVGMETNLAGFHKGLAESGYTEGKNVAIEYRWAQNQAERLPALAADLVHLPVAVIAATRSAAPAKTAMAATSTIPIVFQTGSDPVKDGLVASLNRPGGNVTGATRLTTELALKRLGVILEVAPKATVIGMLANPNGVQTALESAGNTGSRRRPRFGIPCCETRRSDRDLDEAFAMLIKSGANAIIEASDPLFIDRRKQIVALSLSSKIPMIFFERDSVADGGLMTYAADFADSVPPSRHLCRPYPQGREARRPASPATDQVRSGDQPQDGQGHRHLHPANAARDCRRGDRVRRREFITLFGGASIAWPLKARAQQPDTPVIGFLHSGSAAQNAERVVAFRKGLSDGGFIEGRNVAIEFRWADGHYERLPAMTAELVSAHVAVIATPLSTPAALVAKAATATIPIVFSTASDPVALGLVACLNRPGGNVTGITSLNSDLAAKRLGLLRTLMPQADNFFALINPEDALAKPFMTDLQTAATATGITVKILRASTPAELDAVFADFPQRSGNALLVSTNSLFYIRREQIAALAARHGVAASFDDRDYTRAGGLMSYGADSEAEAQQTGDYTARILKGAKPSDLPVMQSEKFQLSDQPQNRQIAPHRGAAKRARHRRRAT